MGGIKRFVLLVFGLAGALCLVALALPWFGPYQREATELITKNDSYFFVVMIAFCITALGIAFSFLRAVFAPRKRRTITVSKSGKDAITVTAAAVSSQASHVVEQQGGLAAERVEIDAKRNGDVRVSVRVRPHVTVNVVEEGQRLHDELMSGLATVCGDKIKGVSLQFVEADQAEPDPEPQPIQIETHAETEALEPAEQERPKRRLFGFGRPRAELAEPVPAAEPAPAATPEPELEAPARLTLDDLVIPADVYERAAQAEAEQAAAAEAPQAHQDSEGITVPVSQLPSEAPALDNETTSASPDAADAVAAEGDATQDEEA